MSCPDIDDDIDAPIFTDLVVIDVGDAAADLTVVSVLVDSFAGVPSHLHEALAELFGRRPTLAAELLVDALGVTVPAYTRVRVDSGEFTDVAPTEYRADRVVVLAAEETPVLAVVVEVQLGRDPGKRYSWPVYLATLRARMSCPALLLVVCPDPGIAAWCAAPIECGQPGWTLRPLVLGPDQVPAVTDPARAVAVPELAVLSAIAQAHRPGTERDRVFRSLLAALGAIEAERAALYHDVVLATLPTAARHHLEALMGTGIYEYQSEFVRKYIFQGRAEGEAKGEARAVLAVLDARGLDIPDDARARITECADLEQLDIWIRRAVTAATVADLFDE